MLPSGNAASSVDRGFQPPKTNKTSTAALQLQKFTRMCKASPAAQSSSHAQKIQCMLTFGYKLDDEDEVVVGGESETNKGEFK